MTLTSSGAVTFVGATAAATEHGVTLTFTFEHRAQRLQFARVYACYPGSQTIETSTRVTSLSGEGTGLIDLVAWNLTMPNGNVLRVSGLRGDSASTDSAVVDAFVFAEHDLGAGWLSSWLRRRSSEEFVPFSWWTTGGTNFLAA